MTELCVDTCHDLFREYKARKDLGHVVHSRDDYVFLIVGFMDRTEDVFVYATLRQVRAEFSSKEKMLENGKLDPKTGCYCALGIGYHMVMSPEEWARIGMSKDWDWEPTGTSWQAASEAIRSSNSRQDFFGQLPS